jgi:hypothetical protein
MIALLDDLRQRHAFLSGRVIEGPTIFSRAADRIEVLEATLRDANEQISELLPYPDPLVRKRLEHICDTVRAALSGNEEPMIGEPDYWQREARIALGRLVEAEAERDRQYDENVNRIVKEGAALLRVEVLEATLKAVEPYLDAIICYASTISEHDGNRVAALVRAAIKEPTS